MRRPPSLVGLAVVSFAYAIVASAQTASGELSSPAPRLKLSPILEPVPPKPPSAAPLSDRGAIFLRADTLEGVSQQWVEASGKVELRARRDTVLADWLRYDFESDEIWGKGNVVLRRGIDSIAGPEARFKRGAETGFFASPKFQIGENASRGDAGEIIFTGPEHYEITDARYTTCVAGNEDWYLQSAQLDIDKSRLVGTAHDATVYFKDVPILHTPWLEFPLSNERKSGFLTPILGSSNSSGFEVAIPYYFNLAPNYDATFIPRLMTRRGVQLNEQFRYLFPSSAGEVVAEVLPDDHVTNTTRDFFSWRHNQSFSSVPGLTAFVDLNKASDNTYFADLADRLAITSQTNLNREGGFAYQRGPMSLVAFVQTFQTLQDPNNPIVPPYFREPEVLFNLNPVEWRGFDVSATALYDGFRQSSQVDGNRGLFYPTLAWSRQGNAWFFTARAGLSMTHYEVDNPGQTSSISRVLPITSLDGGLLFERDANFFGQRFIQTLEPRAYYVYIPYRDQSQIPVFDTASDDFNFSQLFTENRYLGYDRIGDANQITLAVSSRLLDPETGDERMRFAIGQRYYFEGQRVTLPGEVPRTANSSDILLSGEGRLSEAWSLAGLLDYNLTQPQTERLDFAVRWQPGAGRVINASYRFVLQDPSSANSQLKQIDLSAQWPFLGNWSAVARWNYSLVDAKTLEGVAGFEYNGGCWALRIVAQRLQTNTQQTNTSVFVQFELNGLARLGTSPLELLRRSIPGYQTINDPSGANSDVGPKDYFPRY